MKLEYREFSIDDDVTDSIKIYEDAVQFWLHVCNMTSPMGSSKYCYLGTLALNLLAIPASNPDCKWVFSLVRRIKTEFCSSLEISTVSSLIGCHFNKTSKCCENVNFHKSLLANAKHCTRQRNLSYVTQL